jgi:hypothetical protein
MNDLPADAPGVLDLEQTRWRLDRARSSVEFHVRHFYGLITHAAGKSVPLQRDATLRPVDGELEVEAATHADHRELGMTWSPLGILRAPSKLIVRGRLVPKAGNDG